MQNFSPAADTKETLAWPQQQRCWQFLIVNDLSNCLLDICQTNDLNQAAAAGTALLKKKKNYFANFGCRHWEEGNLQYICILWRTTITYCWILGNWHGWKNLNIRAGKIQQLIAALPVTRQWLVIKLNISFGALNLTNTESVLLILPVYNTVLANCVFNQLKLKFWHTMQWYRVAERPNLLRLKPNAKADAEWYVNCVECSQFVEFVPYGGQCNPLGRLHSHGFILGQQQYWTQHSTCTLRSFVTLLAWWLSLAEIARSKFITPCQWACIIRNNINTSSMCSHCK